MLVSIIIPAHNEEENIGDLIDDLEKMIIKNKLDAEIVPVNDHSTDDTSKILKQKSKKYKNIRSLNRTSGPRGMGATLKAGTEYAKGKYVVWTMGDRSDTVTTIPSFIKALDSGADIVFGSRYILNASPGNLDHFKMLLSKGFSQLNKFLFGYNVNDITNAFRAFKKDIFYNLNIKSNDFAISPEFALKAHIAGYKLAEVPTVYKDREKGIPKFKVGRMGISYGLVMLRSFLLRLKRKVVK